jgi:pilus assembly protein CpaE
MVAGALIASETELPRRGQWSSQPLAIQEFISYPPDLARVPAMLAQQFDVVCIDLDSDTEHALDLVAAIVLPRSTTVMVYSMQADRNLVIRCMRAGAREFLALPLLPDDMAGALTRVKFHHPPVPAIGDRNRKTFVFLGAKGGCGVTSIASCFASELARESRRSTLLIDLGRPLGDAAIHLGLSSDYSVLNALEEWNRLDSNFLRSLVVDHDSGLSVLAAPSDFPPTCAPIEAVDRLLAVAQQSFHFVVVDVGSRIDLKDSSLFDESIYLYLVAQVGISAMRNANRLITQFFSMRSQRLQIVINRYASHAFGFNDEQITKALTRSAQWKIPDDDAHRKGVRVPGSDFAEEESAAFKAIRQMARSACGLPVIEEKKKLFRLFKFG